MSVDVKSFSKAKGGNGGSGSNSGISSSVSYGARVVQMARELLDEIESYNISNDRNFKCANAPSPTSMTVIAGGTTIGTRDVIRADADYFDYDMIVLKNLSNEVWIKLPPPQIDDGMTISRLNAKSLKIKNLTGQNCYVYIQDSGYQIYAPDSNSSASYYNIGNGASEFVWTGSEWIWFRCN